MPRDISHSNNYDSVEIGHLAKHCRVYFITKSIEKKKYGEEATPCLCFLPLLNRKYKHIGNAEQAHWGDKLRGLGPYLGTMTAYEAAAGPCCHHWWLTSLLFPSGLLTAFGL